MRLGVERAAILRQPSDVDGFARSELDRVRRVPRFDDEIIVASDRQAETEDVTHIDELFHFGLDGMRIGVQAVFVELDTFRADRHFGFVANLRHVDRLGVNLFAVVQRHNAFVAFDRCHRTSECVVFANELRNEAVFRLFIELIWRSKLLDAAIVKHGNRSDMVSASVWSWVT